MQIPPNSHHASETPCPIPASSIHRWRWLVLLLTISLLAQRVIAGAIGDGADVVLSSRVPADHNSFYVYLDADSGFNHGYPSGYWGNNLGAMTVLPGCVDDPTSPTGYSSDTTKLDEQRGTVMAFEFNPQVAGESVGLNFEEPQDWGVNQELPSKGYNLTGATTLVFDVRSPTPGGITVQFGFDGGTIADVKIPQSNTYQTMSIPLSSFKPAPNLTNAHILFSIGVDGTHSPKGGTVLIDNIHFTPVPAAQASAVTFPVATQTFGITPAEVPPFPLDQVLRNVTTIYESSLAVDLLLARGSTTDVANALIIDNAFDYALGHDNHGDNLPVAPDGSTGLHNGYISGDVSLFNSQFPPEQGVAGDIRLAGFTCATSVTPSGYAVVLDGATGGNNAFAIIALLQAYRQFRNAHYLSDARTIGNWIYGNLLDQSGTGYGGYYAGYNDGGVAPPKPLLLGKSTENNADIFAAFTALAEMDVANAGLWTSRANIAGDFVMEMWDPVNERFNAGTSPVGTAVGPGTQPDPTTVRGCEEINKYLFLDVNTFTTLAMAGAPRYFGQIDWRQPVQYALSNFAKPVTIGSNTFQGFSLVQLPTSGADGIAWEFTGQMVVTMRYVDALYGQTTFESVAQSYLNQIGNAQTSAPFGDGHGIVAATVQGGSTLAPLDQSLNTPYQDIPERVGLAATTWGALAESSVNPFALISHPAAPFTSVHIASNNALPGTATVGDRITLFFTTSVPIKTPKVTIAGYPAAVASSSSTSWTASLVVAKTFCLGKAVFTVNAVGTTGIVYPLLSQTNDGSSVSITAH